MAIQVGNTRAENPPRQATDKDMRGPACERPGDRVDETRTRACKLQDHKHARSVRNPLVHKHERTDAIPTCPR
eukprot:10367377-Alexandrium_andersonii.AAC.1